MLCLFLSGGVFAQTADTLTNSSIVKMVKARLSDDLIIEVIEGSPVQFDLNENTIKNLTEQNVTQRVIEAMKKADEYQNVATANLFATPSKTNEKEVTKTEAVPAVNRVSAPPPQEQKEAAQPQVQSAKPAVEKQTETTPPQKPAASEKPRLPEEGIALGFVVPMKEIISFHESEFESLVATIGEWENKIRDLTDAANRIKEQITRTEKELTALKNADSKGYSDEIINKKKELEGYREDLRKAKEEFVKGGEAISKEMEKISSDRISALGDAYNDASQGIRSADADPSKEPVSAPIRPKGLSFDKETTVYISPALEMLAWHLNKIKETEETIRNWNIKVREAAAKEGELGRQLEPLKSKLEEYQSDTKKYKTEIAAIKKQISAVEKERKNLAGSLEDDSKELSSLMKQARSECQKILEQRFTDIIENINYSFQEKLNL